MKIPTLGRLRTMSDTFLTELHINKVHHLQDFSIPISNEDRKHLILTGKNGCGKTRVLECLRDHLQYLVSDNFQEQAVIEYHINSLKLKLERLNFMEESNQVKDNRDSYQSSLAMYQNLLLPWIEGVITKGDHFALREKYKTGKFVIAYYSAERLSEVETSNTIERIELKALYQIQDSLGSKIVKYMVGLKATQAFALQQNNTQRAHEIEAWFQRFDGVLQTIFADPSTKLDFNIENFHFTIHQDDREPFDFNSLSSGYSAIFAIINDLIMRTEKSGSTTEGIVLIDEIETHLHVKLQQAIMPALTQMFPNLQFIISTHSPLVLNSVDNAVIFDLENKTLVAQGFLESPNASLVKEFLRIERLSRDFREKCERDSSVFSQSTFTDADYADITDLEEELDEQPNNLALDFAAESHRLKLGAPSKLKS